MIPIPNKKYDVICADPPWDQRRGGAKRSRPNTSGGAFEYEVLTWRKIWTHLSRARLHTKRDSVLFLWTIDKYLHEAEELARTIGYKLHARMIWNKKNGPPAAFTVRYGHEYLLFMYKGKLLPVAKGERGRILTVFTERAKRHSQKPDVAYSIIERLYPDALRLEMYARRKRPGWDAGGDEIEEGESINVKIATSEKRKGLEKNEYSENTSAESGGPGRRDLYQMRIDDLFNGDPLEKSQRDPKPNEK